MPTYKNKNGMTKTIGSNSIRPNEIKRILTFDTIEGVEMLSETPMHNPTILAVKLTESTIVKIPEGETRFAIHFCVEKGEPVIWYNSKENKPPLKLYEGAKWNERTYERLIDKLIVELPENSILWIIIERT